MMYYGRKVLEKSIHLSGSLEYRFLDKINYAFEELYIEDEDWAKNLIGRIRPTILEVKK